MILEYTAAVFNTLRATLILPLDDLVDDTVEGISMRETGLAIEEQFARNDGLEVRTIFTQQLLDYFELKVSMVLGRARLLAL